MPRSVYWPLRHMSNSPRAHAPHGTGSGRRTTPTTRSPGAKPLPSGASRTRPSDSWPRMSRSSPGGAQPYSPPTISMSVPQMPRATPSSSSSPSRGSGSGTSVPAAELAFSGMTASARTPGRLTGQRLAPDRGQHLARVVARQLVGGEEHVRGCDLVRLRGALHRHLLAERLDLVLRERGHDQRRPDRPRRHAVHPDLALHQGLGESEGEHVDRALRGGVVDQLLVAAQAVDRPGVDDRRTLAHVLERLVGAPPRAVDVRLERALPLLGGDLARVVDRRLRAGVVHQDVDLAQLV